MSFNTFIGGFTYENCCCKNASTSELINYLLVFTIINLVLSFVAIFLRAAKTGRYDDALMYLEARNNGTLTNFNYDEFKKDGYIFKDAIYCKINGEFLKNLLLMLVMKVYIKNCG